MEVTAKGKKYQSPRPRYLIMYIINHLQAETKNVIWAPKTNDAVLRDRISFAIG